MHHRPYVNQSTSRINEAASRNLLSKGVRRRAEETARDMLGIPK